MADPVRWLSDPASAPEGALELLRTAEPLKQMSAVSHARALLHVTQLSTAKVTAFGVIATAKTAALVIASTTAAAAAVTSIRTRLEPAPAVPTVATAAPERPTRATERARRAVEQAPERAAGPILQLEDLEHARPSDPVASPAVAEGAERPHDRSAPEKAVVAGNLAAERAVIERARASLRVDPHQALELAREHQVRYPAGQLQGAARVIEVEALRALGRDGEAKQRAEATIQSDPNGLYTERMSRAARQTGGVRKGGSP